MHGASGTGCQFCDLETFRCAELFIQSDLSFFASNSFGDRQVLPGAGIACPRAHRESPFELTGEEWADTQVLLRQAKAALDERLRPDGYNLVWNVKPDAGQEVAHVHLHLIPRFHDEPYAGRGGRWLLRQAENLRPAPSAPGRGRAVD